MNPRYLAYCNYYHTSPDDMMAVDDARFPGGIMAGYIVWISARWGEWRRLRGMVGVPTGLLDHADFDAWLKANGE